MNLRLPTPCLALLAGLLLPSAADAVDIVAHRGASFDAPENTLAAEKLAWKQNADAVETDIHLSKDGKLAVSHDKTTKRTAGRDALIADLTMAELKELDAGTWKTPKFAGEKIPVLDEQIALIPRGKRMLVEIKIGPEIVPELKRCLARTGASEKNITIISFNFESLKEVRKQLPRYQTLWLLGYRSPAAAKKAKAAPSPTVDEMIRDAKAAGLTGLDLQHTFPLTPADTKKIRDAGLQLHVWTVDEPEVAKHWIDLGVASITTNRPGWLREQLKL
ncbi:MAG: glycerophosphodiester phosphodiesterase [Opitutaceae bacterium]|nr:glycerophosphodiester phosphodiesterase [Opitutaceae bacterium]